METMAIGMFAVMGLIVSGCCLYYKKLFWGFLSGIVTVALTCWTGYSWKLMLVGSGKDATLLGFYRYPAALIILAILLIAAFVFMIVSIVWMVRRNKSKV